MSLSGTISVLQGITGATPVGGAAVSFVNDGKGVLGKKVLVDSSEADPSLRKKIITDVVIGHQPQTGSAKLHRSSVTVHQPYADSNGVVYPLPDNFNVSYHPGMTAAERETKFWNTISVIIDSELANLRNMIND